MRRSGEARPESLVQNAASLHLLPNHPKHPKHPTVKATSDLPVLGYRREFQQAQVSGIGTRMVFLVEACAAGISSRYAFISWGFH